ncbi:hypothetical protein ACFU96_31365 [Streptomyces sp. NPDC057620]|uniref:Uncharacterized protein n=1 Tax=Streptomyces liliiviolaceus TaxID=2823109 RepID=A0A941B4Q5_9ACTN|nr:hypothetical protein [Streptomyces liliiviolaceus]MBQ0847361.1 hypothetical protein [Streptomyces liliiviolaceus]
MSTHSEPLRRLALDRLIKDAGGTALPDDASDEPHFAELLDECAALIDEITFTKKNDGHVAQATMGAHPLVTYDPAYSSGEATTDDVPFRTASILHEIMHVSVDKLYDKPTDPSEKIYWQSVNFHYATTAGSSFAEQSQTVTENLQKVMARATADSKVDTTLRSHIERRYIYGCAGPHVHYDTVLLDLLVYLRLKGHSRKNVLFAYLTKLSQEARNRRMDSKGGPVPPASAT